MLDFLGPELQSNQNIGWPIRNDKLHNHMNALEIDMKVDDLKVFC